MPASNSNNFTFIDETESFAKANSSTANTVEDIQEFSPVEDTAAEPIAKIAIPPPLPLETVDVSASGEDQRRRKATVSGDCYLMEETIRANPFLLKRGSKGTLVKEDAWNKIAERVNELQRLDGNVSNNKKPIHARYAKERINHLRKKAEKHRSIIQYGSSEGGGHDTRLERCYKDLLKMFYDNDILKVQTEQDNDATALKRLQDEKTVQTAALTGCCMTSGTKKDKRRRLGDSVEDINSKENRDNDALIANFAKLAIKEEKDLELLKKQRQHYIDAARATEVRIKQLEEETKELRQELLELRSEMMDQRSALHVLRDTIQWMVTCTQELFNKILNINLQLPPSFYPPAQ
ncbi:hypothetical protein INT45_011885 [Circinella minor]|uniref:Uncharacterized protein n=1 Tax=Circinella minor TaxID=1195481 RepID=A0A8H7RTY8_9FUNG|nr:hypothetical protein INT45_011885 [Circinella minor]